MLHTIKSITKNFSLLHLDYNEILLDTNISYFFNLNSSLLENTHKHESSKSQHRLMSNENIILKHGFLNNILKGKLHFTTVSIIFEPDDLTLPVIKFFYYIDEEIKSIIIFDIADIEAPLSQKPQEVKANLIAASVPAGSKNFGTQKGNAVNTLINVNTSSNLKKSNEKEKVIKRYDEKNPIHVEAIKLESSLMKLMLNKEKRKSTIIGINTNISNNILPSKEYNQSSEIKLIKSYFQNKGIDHKLLFDAMIKYYLCVNNKDKKNMNYSFVYLKTSYITKIYRHIYKSYFREEILSEEFLFLIEGTEQKLNDFKEMSNYLIEGIQNSNEVLGLVDNIINKVITNKTQEMENEEKAVLSNQKSDEQIEPITNINSDQNYHKQASIKFNTQIQNSVSMNNSVNNNSINNSVVVTGNNINILINNENSRGSDEMTAKFKFEYYLFRFKANRILPEGQQTGLFIIKDKAEIVFMPITNNYKQNINIYKLDKVSSVLKYRYIHQEKALKIVFFKSSREKIFEFESYSDCNEVYNYLIKNSPNLNDSLFNIKYNTHRWVDGLMSNYDYLLFLNIVSSRSFSDLSQYPVFPWVLTDYSSESIDLTNDKVYRDLSKPIGVLSKSFPDSYKKYEHLKGQNEEAYFYGMHYSNPQVINHFLIRSFPQLLQNFENGSFGKCERIFNSIYDLWEFIMNSNSDLRELIPEFYHGDGDFLLCFQEILLEKNENLKSVKLPKWAKSPINFINTMKSALESDYVSNNLHHWIDLIFGYKSSGVEADKANNVFHPNAYEEKFDVTKYIDTNPQAYFQQILNFGQVPVKLFDTPHPKKIKGKNFFSEYIINNPDYVYHAQIKKLEKEREIIEKNLEKLRRIKEAEKEKF